MPLTRRVQVFISQEASDALDTIVKKAACSQTRAIELALDSYAAWMMLGSHPDNPQSNVATSLDAVSDARGKATVETHLPLARRTVQPIPKPGKGKK